MGRDKMTRDERLALSRGKPHHPGDAAGTGTPKADDREAEEIIAADLVLSDRHQAFVDAYLGPARFDGRQAARMAGYKPTPNNLAVIATVLLKRPDVRAQIAERTKLKAMGADEALAHLADIARGSMADFIDEDAAKEGNFKFDLAKAAEADKLHLVRKIRQSSEGELHLELYNKLEALMLIMRQLGLFKDQVNVGITIDAVLERLPDGVRDSVGRRLAEYVSEGGDQGQQGYPALPPRRESGGVSE